MTDPIADIIGDYRAFAAQQRDRLAFGVHQDRGAAMFVISQDGARAVESRSPGETGGAEHCAIQRNTERKPATGAGRTVQKRDRAPAGGAAG